MSGLRFRGGRDDPWSAPRGTTEVVIPLGTGVAPVSRVRSTLLGSSLQATRELGLLGRYKAALPLRYHEPVLHTLGAVWLPVSVAMAHYRAMDELELSDDEVMAIGRAVGNRLHGSFLGTLVRGAKHVGMTPWTLASKLDRVWSRVFDGGHIGVWKLGPKDGLIALRGLPLLQFHYFRVGWRGVVSTGVETIVSKCYAREAKTESSSDAVDLIVSWV